MRPAPKPRTAPLASQARAGGRPSGGGSPTRPPVESNGVVGHHVRVAGEHGDADPAGRKDRDNHVHEAGQRSDELANDASDLVATDRDMVSELHDRAAEHRDERAEARDLRAEAREQHVDAPDAGAAADRAGARRDRRGGAGDRGHAADDRDAASMDRRLSARQRTAASVDELTGAHRRGAGMERLALDLARAKSSGESFVLGFVDVDGLKATNDLLGHSGGDRLLVRVAATMRAHLRPDDLVVRFGGDEFLCGMKHVSAEEAAKRFTQIRADLAESKASVTVGLAELTDQDSLDDLVMRANGAMHAKRQRHYRKSTR